MRVAFALFLLLIGPATAHAHDRAADEAAIRRVIASWYASLQDRGRVASTLAQHGYQLYAPSAIDGGPQETETNPQSRALSPSISNELAARALRFSYEIDVLTIDPHFAKVIVWERGYFYAWAAQRTYENAASTLFIFEKQNDGQWLILAHQANSQGIPPNKITDPMPDLRDLYYATQGKGRDPEADARNADKF
jgi:hypothetical protein